MEHADTVLEVPIDPMDVEEEEEVMEEGDVWGETGGGATPLARSQIMEV